jgi:hypothetical protein
MFDSTANTVSPIFKHIFLIVSLNYTSVFNSTVISVVARLSSIPTVPIEVIHGFPHSFQKNAE